MASKRSTIMSIIATAILVVSLAGCVAEPVAVETRVPVERVPGPYWGPGPGWVPGHYNPYGYWIPGHWR